MKPREVNLDEDEDRAEWDRARRELPLPQLVDDVQIDVAPTPDPGWGKVMRVEIASDPPQFTDLGWRDSDICPICAKATSIDYRIAATIYLYFESGFSYGKPCWIHEACLATCAEIVKQAPVPW